MKSEWQSKKFKKKIAYYLFKLELQKGTTAFCSDQEHAESCKNTAHCTACDAFSVSGRKQNKTKKGKTNNCHQINESSLLVDAIIVIHPNCTKSEWYKYWTSFQFNPSPRPCALIHSLAICMQIIGWILANFTHRCSFWISNNAIQNCNYTSRSSQIEPWWERANFLTNMWKSGSFASVKDAGLLGKDQVVHGP